jgi:hypothetical protein
MVAQATGKMAVSILIRQEVLNKTTFLPEKQAP